MFTKERRLSLASFHPHLKTHPLSFGLLKIGSNTLPYSRFAVLVTKRIDKRAVIRNANRRTLLRVLKSLEETIPQGVDVLLIPRRDITSLPVDTLLAELKQFFLK